MSISAGAIGAGLISRLVSSGVQRLGSLILQKVIRVGRIESALKGNAQKNPAIQAAIDDFETVIGSRYGELNTELFEFLREVERSGIINSMVENALIGRDASELKRIFRNVHDQVIGAGKGSADLLFDRMMTSFEITMQEVTKDRVLLDAFRTHRHELERRLDRVDLALVQLTSKAKMPFKDLQETLLKIGKGLQSAYRSVRVETNKGARSVDISRIYIPPKLSFRETRINAAKIASATEVLKRGSKRRTRSSSLFDAHPELAGERLNRISYGDLRLLFSRAVILGDPGGGKSTLCQHLCYDLARQAVASLQADSSQLTAQLQKFPLRVILRTYEKARTIEPQLSLYNYILRDLMNHAAAEDSEIDSALRYLLSSGSAVLAFDGLDEILATAQRREFVDLVTAFCNQFPLCPVLVTSRLVGYDDAHLPDEFDELILAKFDDDEVRSYVTKFMKVVGGHGNREAVNRANLFFRQTTSNAADLRRNPLMLGLMAWLFNVRGDVPSNRPEIYRECAILMFEKWDPDRDIQADIPANFDRLQLFSNIAAKIFGNPELSAGVEDSWLETETKSFFQEVYENKAQAYQAAKALVSFITGRAWVMSEMGDKVFAFTHQTFLEYFFARHIDDMHDTVKEVLAVIVPRISRREWDMVSHLSLQIKTHRNLRRQNEAPDQLRATIKVAEDHDQELALISFAARSLEYLAGSEAHIKPLVSDIIEAAFTSPREERNVFWLSVSQCANCSADRREFVQDVIVEMLIREFRSGDEKRMSVAKDAIFAFANDRHIRPHESPKLPLDLAARARDKLKSYITERMEQSAVHAITGWQWYGVISKALIAKHGIAAYYWASLMSSAPIDGLSSIALAATRRFVGYFPQHIRYRTAKDALSAIGTVGFSALPPSRSLFPKKTAPTLALGLWRHLLHDAAELSPAMLAGCLFAMMMVTELEEREEEDDADNGKKTHKIRRRDLIDFVISQKGVQQLSIFSKMQHAARVGSIFSDGWDHSAA